MIRHMNQAHQDAIACRRLQEVPLTLVSPCGSKRYFAALLVLKFSGKSLWSSMKPISTRDRIVSLQLHAIDFSTHSNHPTIF